MEEYNPKIDIKFLTILSDDFNFFESELRVRRIYKGLIHPVTFYEKEFHQFAHVVDLIRNANNIDSTLLISIIKMCDTNFDEKTFQHTKLLSLLNSDITSLETMVDIFIESMKLLKESDRRLSLSILIFNIPSLLRKDSPLILFNRHKFQVKDIINNFGYDKDRLLLVFKDAYSSMGKYRKSHEFIPLDIVLKRLGSIKNELLNQYNVISLSIYGSYSRREENKYSDLDLLATLDDGISIETFNKLDLVHFLKNKVQLPVDVILFQEIGKTKVVPDDIFETAIKVF